MGPIGPAGPAGSANINGTTNTVVKFTGPTSGGNSSITDDGTTVTTSDQFDVTGGAGTGYTTAPIEVRTTATPRIAFHWPGVVASQLGMDAAGVIRTYNNPGNAYEQFAASNLYANGFVNATGDVRSDGVVYWGNGLVRTETKDDPGLLGNQGARSGFFETSAPTAGNFYPNASSWQHYIEVRHSNNGINFAMQIGGSFFDEDLWYRKTNNAANTTWLQLIGSGPRQCTAPFNAAGATMSTAVGGITRSNTICATPRFSGQNFNDAQDVCFALGGHISTYNEMYRLSIANGAGNVLFNGDWIGNRAGDDQAYCVNGTNLSNFEGICDKNDGRTYRCVNSSTSAN